MEISPPPKIDFDDDPAILMDQLDGNITLNFSMTSSTLESDCDIDVCPPQHIPTQVGHRPAKVITEQPPFS